MFAGLFAREWQRTCAECGYTWRVRRSIARRGIHGLPAMSALGQARAGRRSPSGMSSLGSDIEARAELMQGFRICAKCGADDFTRCPCPRGERSAG